MSRKSKLLEELGKNIKNIDFEEIEKIDIDVLKDLSITLKMLFVIKKPKQKATMKK